MSASETLEPAKFTPEMHALLIAHYERVAPLLVASFAGTPLVAGFVHDWSTKVMTYEEGVAHPPASIATIDVPLRPGPAKFATVETKTILWQAHRGAIALLGWSPTRDDPARVAFGRVILEPCGIATGTMVKDGARVFRDLLAAAGLESVVLLNGDGGLALWIPFSDAPKYDAVRARLDALAEEAAVAHPALLTTAHPLSERGDRVHVACSSNAVGRFSALPYSLRGRDALQVVTPIAWSELAQMDSGDVTAANFPDRLARSGDVFAKEVAAIGAQPTHSFLGAAPVETNATFVPTALNGEPRGRIIQAAIAILDDGKPRDADAILAEAIARDLIPKTTTRKDVYTELIEYISRAKGHDRKPKIVQDIDRKFRRNLTPDDWPNPATPLPKRAPAPGAQELVARLQATGAGDDPAAYEQAVCDVGSALGFVARHVGGEEATDGYLDAPLGVLGYRVMLECKRATTIVQEPDAAEAAKYVAAYKAQYAALIGPAFGDDVQLASELQTHGVAAFTNDDLITLLENGANPSELRHIFSSGFAAERIEELLWLRDHGERKRLAVICETIVRKGLEAQRMAAKSGDYEDAPRLDVDAAMLLVDAYVLSEEGSQSPCTRIEVTAAFSHLTSVAIGAATWIDESKQSIVING